MLIDGVQAKNRLPVSVRDQMITILVKMMEMWRNCVDELSLVVKQLFFLFFLLFFLLLFLFFFLFLL